MVGTLAYWDTDRMLAAIVIGVSVRSIFTAGTCSVIANPVDCTDCQEI